MEKRQIINIINFIRGCEPRPGRKIDLIEPVTEQIALMKKHNLKGSFMVQYDALINEDFQKLLLELDPEQFEISVWFEIVQQLAEKVGIEWKGRYSWDWHAQFGFSAGYTKLQKEAMIDTLFEDFKAVFGYYPKTLGSWSFDAYVIEYAQKRYGLTAACNCKDQWGTDGYNMWGGYYGQAYYPNRYNSFAPAQKPENQLDVPVFRMLGSDPIYQYDYGFYNDGSHLQGVISLEPVYSGSDGGGGVPKWVDWYMNENFNGKCLTFGYAQAGQENSFGWPGMKNGLTYQFSLFEKLQNDGKIDVEKFVDSGEWYKESYPATPASTIVADQDWRGEGHKSVWYSSKNYRINFYVENGGFYIRDLFLFRDDYHERYLDGGCTSDTLTYDNLPVMDVRFSSGRVKSGLYPSAGKLVRTDGKAGGMIFDEMLYAEENGNARLTFTGTDCGDVEFLLTEDAMTVTSTKGDLQFTPVYDEPAKKLVTVTKAGDALVYTYNGFTYQLSADGGSFDEDYALVCGKQVKVNLAK